MAAPESQFQSAGITTPFYQPVETHLAAPISLPLPDWGKVSDAITSATNTIMSSRLNPYVRAQQDAVIAKAQANINFWKQKAAEPQGGATTEQMTPEGITTRVQPRTTETDTTSTEQKKPSTSTVITTEPKTTDTGTDDTVKNALSLDGNKLLKAYDQQNGDPDNPFTSYSYDPKTGDYTFTSADGKKHGSLKAADAVKLYNSLPKDTGASTSSTGRRTSLAGANVGTTTAPGPGDAEAILASLNQNNAAPVGSEQAMQAGGTAGGVTNTPPATIAAPQITPAQAAAGVGASGTTPPTTIAAPQVNHPVLSSQAALEYAKSLDTAATRAIYVPNGPQGPGHMITTKGGGSYFLPVSQVAQHNPGVVLADNMNHGLAAASANDQAQAAGQTAQAQQPQANVAPPPQQQYQIPSQFQGPPEAPGQPVQTTPAPVRNIVQAVSQAPGPADVAAAAAQPSTERGEAVQASSPKTITLGGIPYNVINKSNFAYQLMDPATGKIFSYQDQGLADRQKLYETGKTRMTPGEVMDLDDATVKKLTSQYSGKEWGKDEDDLTGSIYHGMVAIGRPLDLIYGIRRNQPELNGATMDAMKWIQDENAAGRTPNYETWVKTHPFDAMDDKTFQTVYKNANDLNGELQSAASRIVAYARMTAKSPLDELQRAGFTLVSQSAGETKSGHWTLALKNILGGGQSQTEQQAQQDQKIQFDLNNPKRLADYYQSMGDDYLRRYDTWHRNNWNMPDHVTGYEVKGLQGGRHRVPDNGEGIPKWEKWEDKPNAKVTGAGEKPPPQVVPTPTPRPRSSTAPNPSTSSSTNDVSHLSDDQVRQAVASAAPGTQLTFNGETRIKTADGRMIPMAA